VILGVAGSNPVGRPILSVDDHYLIFLTSDSAVDLANGHEITRIVRHFRFHESLGGAYLVAFPVNWTESASARTSPPEPRFMGLTRKVGQKRSDLG
jgi:hypothetical protein